RGARAGPARPRAGAVAHPAAEAAVTFATPWLIWIAVAAPFAVAALQLYDRARRRARLGRLGELPVVGKVSAGAAPGRRVTQARRAGGAVALIARAAARPQVAGTRQVELHGLDLVVAVDVSKSMMVDDVGATREMTARHLETTRLARAR